jgi:hypothetical protein
MSTIGKRGRFGRLFGATLTLAILTLIGRGVWESWPAWYQAWMVRAHFGT